MHDLRVSVGLTATSLEGTTRRIGDSNGGELFSRDHRVRFDFDQRDFQYVGPKLPALVDNMARACRSTASFPFAFEPSPIADSDGHVTGVAGHAHLVDGGVLVNLPASDAIESIVRNPATDRVQRVLALVVPDPEGPPRDPGAAGGAPAITDVLSGSLLGIPRNQSLHGFIDEVAQHNVDVRARAAARNTLLETVDGPGLVGIAHDLFPAYRANRTAAAIRSTVDGVRNMLADRLAAAIATEDTDLIRRLRARIGEPIDAKSLAHVPLPFVPMDLSRGATEWCWGAMTVRRLTTLLRSIANDAGLPDNEVREVKGLLRDVQGCIDPGGRLELLGLNSNIIKQATGSDTPSLHTIVVDCVRSWPLLPATGDTGRTRKDLNALLDRLGEAAILLAEKLPALTRSETSGFRSVFSDCTPKEATERLLALEVIELAFAGFHFRTEQEIDLRQITSQRRSPMDPSERRSAATKLAGVQLGHFGAFLKRSWRANDWMWGRLDASTWVVDLLHRGIDGTEGVAEIVRADTRAVQQHVLREELPILATEIRADVKAGSPASARALAFLAHYDLAEKRQPLARADGDELSGLLELNRIGEERIEDDIGSDPLVRTMVTAVATSTSLLNRNGPMLLRTPLGVARIACSVRLVCHSPDGEGEPGRVGGLVGLILGVGLTTVAIDLFTRLDLGPVTFAAWIAVAAILFLGLVRAPLFAVPMLALAVLPGLLSMTPPRPRWYPPEVWWPHIPELAAAASFVIAFVAIGTLRRFRWADDQLRAIGTEKALLGRLPPTPTWRLVAPPLVIAVSIVAIKNLWIADWSGWPDWSLLGLGQETTQLVTRNLVLALPLLAVLLFGSAATGDHVRRRKLRGQPILGSDVGWQWASGATSVLVAAGALTAGRTRRARCGATRDLGRSPDGGVLPLHPHRPRLRRHRRPMDLRAAVAAPVCRRRRGCRSG